jgi:hypothetical protein
MHMQIQLSEPLSLFVLGSTLFAASYVLQRLLKGAVRFINRRPIDDLRPQGKPTQVSESTLAGFVASELAEHAVTTSKFPTGMKSDLPSRSSRGVEGGTILTHQDIELAPRGELRELAHGKSERG